MIFNDSFAKEKDHKVFTNREQRIDKAPEGVKVFTKQEYFVLIITHGRVPGEIKLWKKLEE